MIKNIKTNKGEEEQQQEEQDKDDHQFDTSITLLPIRKRAQTTLKIPLSHNEDKHDFSIALKAIVRSPQAKDYLKDLSIHTEEEDRQPKNDSSEITLTVFSGLEPKKSKFEVGFDQSQIQQQMTIIDETKRDKNTISLNLNKLQHKNSDPDSQITFQLRDKCKSFSTATKSPKRIKTLAQSRIQSPLISSKEPSSQNTLTLKNEKKLSLESKSNEKPKKIINNQAQQKSKSQSNSKDSKKEKDFIIQKKANSYFNLQNLMDFHSKRQLLKCIRNKPNSNINNNNSSSMSQADTNSQIANTQRRLTRDSAMLNLNQQQQNQQLEDIQEKGFLENFEIDLPNSINQKSYYQKYRKLNQKHPENTGQGIQKKGSIAEELRMSDYFFVGSQHSNQKALQVRLQLDEEQEMKSQVINIFKNEGTSKNSFSPDQKSNRFSLENKMNYSEIGGNRSKNPFNTSGSPNISSDQKDTRLNNMRKINHLTIPTLPNHQPSSSDQFELQKVFSTRLKQSVVLEKHHLDSKEIHSPVKEKSFTLSGQPFKDSFMLSQQKGGNSPSITQHSKSGKSPSQSNRGSRYSGFESSSMMFIDDDEEEIKRQKKRREQSPLNYLFQKYPDVIKENYSFMKMKMKQIVDIHDTLQPTAEEQLIEDYQKYSDKINNKLKNKLMIASSKQEPKANVPLLNLKKGLNIQQKKLYSQINQLTYEVEMSKKQMKYLNTHQNQFNRTATNLDDTIIPSSYFNVSDFIYKNHHKNRCHPGYRLQTQ